MAGGDATGSSEPVTLSVHLMNTGDTHTLRVDGDAPIDTIRRRLAAATTLPRDALKLVCGGEVLETYEEPVSSLRRMELTAWTPRDSKARSDAAHAAAEDQRRREAERRARLAEPLWRRAWAAARLH